MCGIAGIAGGRRRDETLDRMLQAIAHRGPDDRGQAWAAAPTGGWVGLGNTRLAILDLSPAGHQPFRDTGPDGAADRLLAYNGEVFNFAELRDELAAQGETFLSGTDTEVVHRMLARYGTAALARLNGMFALASWDRTRGELVLARDRFGIKPLYWWSDGTQLVFGSETRCLFEAGVPRELDHSSLPDLFTFGYVPGDDTLFAGVHELAPGHLLRWSPATGVRIEPFRDTLPRPDESMTFADATERLRAALTDAVRRQFVADVPVGVLLSGGLDSSTIAALGAAKHQGAHLHAFTIAFRSEDQANEQNVDDARFAGLVADRFGMQLHRLEVTPTITERLGEVSRHLDEPLVDPSAILTLLIAEAAAAEVTVLLSGMGADELFAGYRLHGYDRFARLAGRLPASVTTAGLRALDATVAGIARVPRVRSGLALAGQRAVHNIAGTAHLDPIERYIGMRSSHLFGRDGVAALLHPDLRPLVAKAPGPDFFRSRMARPGATATFVDRMLYADLKTFLPNQNLAYSDRLSMAASIELRVPFLDDAVADLALAIPSRHKLRRFTSKAVLREAMRGIVPDSVIDRRKAGFGAPIRTWLANGDLQPLIDDTLSDERLAHLGVFDPAAVRSVVAAHGRNGIDNTYKIWSLLSFSSWHREHFTDRPAARNA